MAKDVIEVDGGWYEKSPMDKRIKEKVTEIAEKLFHEVDPLFSYDCYGDDFYDMKDFLIAEVNRMFGCIED